MLSPARRSERGARCGNATQLVERLHRVCRRFKLR
jgi:hypothetical protein